MWKDIFESQNNQYYVPLTLCELTIDWLRSIFWGGRTAAAEPRVKTGFIWLSTCFPEIALSPAWKYSNTIRGLCIGERRDQKVAINTDYRILFSCQTSIPPKRSFWIISTQIMTQNYTEEREVTTLITTTQFWKFKNFRSWMQNISNVSAKEKCKTHASICSDLQTERITHLENEFHLLLINTNCTQKSKACTPKLIYNLNLIPYTIFPLGTNE